MVCCKANNQMCCIFIRHVLHNQFLRRLVVIWDINRTIITVFYIWVIWAHINVLGFFLRLILDYFGLCLVFFLIPFRAIKEKQKKKKKTAISWDLKKKKKVEINLLSATPTSAN